MAGSLRWRTSTRTEVKEYVKHSWFALADGGLNPADGKTNAEFTEYNIDDKYSWAKAPATRTSPWKPARSPACSSPTCAACSPSRRSSTRPSAALGAAGKPEVLVSLLGRVAARNLEAAVVADWSLEWVNELIAALKGGDVELLRGQGAAQGAGAGLWEAPRGAVGHWMDDRRRQDRQLPDLHAVHVEHRWTRRRRRPRRHRGGAHRLACASTRRSRSKLRASPTASILESVAGFT